MLQNGAEQLVLKLEQSFQGKGNFSVNSLIFNMYYSGRVSDSRRGQVNFSLASVWFDSGKLAVQTITTQVRPTKKTRCYITIMYNPLSWMCSNSRFRFIILSDMPTFTVLSWDSRFWHASHGLTIFNSNLTLNKTANKFKKIEILYIQSLFIATMFLFQRRSGHAVTVLIVPLIP